MGLGYILVSLLAGAVTFLAVFTLVTGVLGGVGILSAILAVPLGALAGAITGAWTYVYLASFVYRRPAVDSNDPQ